MKVSYHLIIFTFFFLAQCTKSSFLDAKSDQSLIEPKTLEDFQLLLDNTIVMNGSGIGLVPMLSITGSDDYYMYKNAFNTELATYPLYRSLYTWQDDIFRDLNKKPEDWGFGYRCINYSNLILDRLSKIDSNTVSKESYRKILGSALFFRAHMFFQLAQIFAPPYKNASANDALAIPIRLTYDVSETNVRATVKEVYKQVINDLNKASELLPVLPAYNTQPSKASTFGLLSRVYLQMQDYNNSLLKAEECLNLVDTLMDYNTIAPSRLFPFRNTNPEIIFYSLIVNASNSLINPYYSRVDSNLYFSYHNNDLRKSLFFRDASFWGLPEDEGVFFRGSYDGTAALFGGIATDEIFLNKAECLARLGNIDIAMKVLDKLMIKRWNKNMEYQPFNSGNKEEALEIVLTERRKELLMRGLRWSDLRRLNNEGAGIIISRIYNGQIYVLPPNSLKYTYLIPRDVITANPGMQQNPR